MGGILGVTTLIAVTVGVLIDSDDSDTTKRRAVPATPEVVTEEWCDKHWEDVDPLNDVWLTCFDLYVGPPSTTVPQIPVPVSYELTGHGSVSVTMWASGDPEQLTTTLPYHLDLGAVDGFVFISAQLQGEGTVTCTIKQGDRVIQTATSSGHDRIATCSGSVEEARGHERERERAGLFA